MVAGRGKKTGCPREGSFSISFQKDDTMEPTARFGLSKTGERPEVLGDFL